MEIMEERGKPKLAFKLWFETEEGYVFGPGVYRLLTVIKKTGTLKEAAKRLDMSYRYAWGLIKKAEETLGESLIEAHKGGRAGGGSTFLTPIGERYVEEFADLKEVMENVSEHLDEGIIIQELEGRVDEIKEGKDFLEVVLSVEDPLTLKIPLTRAPKRLALEKKVKITLGCYLDSIQEIP
jgi:molybdate transport repressor ModE-like protein